MKSSKLVICLFLSLTVSACGAPMFGYDLSSATYSVGTKQTGRINVIEVVAVSTDEPESIFNRESIFGTASFDADAVIEGMEESLRIVLNRKFGGEAAPLYEMHVQLLKIELTTGLITDTVRSEIVYTVTDPLTGFSDSREILSEGNCSLRLLPVFTSPSRFCPIIDAMSNNVSKYADSLGSRDIFTIAPEG